MERVPGCALDAVPELPPLFVGGLVICDVSGGAAGVDALTEEDMGRIYGGVRTERSGGRFHHKGYPRGSEEAHNLLKPKDAQ